MKRHVPCPQIVILSILQTRPIPRIQLLNVPEAWSTAAMVSVSTNMTFAMVMSTATLDKTSGTAVSIDLRGSLGAAIFMGLKSLFVNDKKNYLRQVKRT